MLISKKKIITHYKLQFKRLGNFREIFALLAKEGGRLMNYKVEVKESLRSSSVSVSFPFYPINKRNQKYLLKLKFSSKKFRSMKTALTKHLKYPQCLAMRFNSSSTHAALISLFFLNVFSKL